VTNGNVVGFWQTALWADNFLGLCGGAGADGIFGSITRTATISWQQRYGLSADGVIGANTWTTAYGFVINYPPGSWNYYGRNQNFPMSPQSDGWWFEAQASPGGVWRTFHPYITFSRC